MYKKTPLLLLLAILPFSLFGQVINGTLKDAVNSANIAGAQIVSVPGNKLAISDSLGRFSIAISENDMLLKISHLNYQQTEIPVKSATGIILLNPRNILLSEVMISDQAMIIFESKTHQVLDYAFSSSFTLILGYKNSPEKSILFVLDSTFKTVKSVPVPYPAKGLFTDAFGNVHIICAAQTLQIDLLKNESGINILFQESTLDAFRATLLPLTAQNGAYYFYEKYAASKLAVSYSALNIRTNTQISILTITDSVRTQMYEDEAHRRVNHERIMQSGMGSPAIDFLLKSDPFFTEAILYKDPVAASLHIINDSVYIFNLCSGDTYVYDNKATLVRKFKLPINLVNKRPDAVIVDEITQQAYLLTADGRHSGLQQINLLTGRLGNEIVLEFPYPKNVRMHAGWIWFQYREKETFQNTSLYRKPL
ncbi:MAG: hypothetical protein IM638_16500 [Bacteroidetes bacterium]|nr:hypothetical protein [Bacteroidota bacterium]